MEKYKIEIKWALIFTAVSLAWMFIEKSLGWHSTHIDKHATYTNFFAIIAIAVYVFALLDKRKSSYDGFMTWKEGLIAGVIMSLIITLLAPLAQWITINVITPDYFPNAIQYAVESGNSTQAEAESFFNLKNYMIQATMGALLMGVITSAIVAFFVKKSPK